jgi:hypothetical protein
MGSLPDLQTAIVVLEVPEIGKGPDCRALALTLQNALKSRKVSGRMEARIQPGATLKLCSILSQPQSFRLGGMSADKFLALTYLRKDKVTTLTWRTDGVHSIRISF